MNGNCPYCDTEFDKIKECHPFSSDAGAYWICEGCNTTYDEGEYLELWGEYEEYKDLIQRATESAEPSGQRDI